MFAIGEIEAEIDLLVDFERGMALNGCAFFADVDDLVQVEHRGLRLVCEGCVGTPLNPVARAPATVG